MTLKGLDALCGLGVPDLEGFVVTARNNQRLLRPCRGDNCDTIHVIRMTFQSLDAFCSLRVPDLECAVLTSGNNQRLLRPWRGDTRDTQHRLRVAYAHKQIKLICNQGVTIVTHTSRHSSDLRAQKKNQVNLQPRSVCVGG